jgi:hypothetical protein
LAEPVQIAVIGTGGGDFDSFRNGLAADAEGMTRLVEGCGQAAEISVFEVRLPPNSEDRNVVNELRAFGEVGVFLELPWDDALADSLACIAEAGWLGAKARTGGLDSAAFPSAAKLAMFLKAAIDLQVPFKLTAGLHHPYPLFNAAIGATMHGFLNVLAACALHESSDLTLAEIEDVLSAGPGRFVWNEDGLRFNGLFCPANELASIRESFVALGSCSIDDPLAELSALGL